MKRASIINTVKHTTSLNLIVQLFFVFLTCITSAIAESNNTSAIREPTKTTNISNGYTTILQGDSLTPPFTLDTRQSGTVNLINNNTDAVTPLSDKKWILPTHKTASETVASAYNFPDQNKTITL